MAPQLFSFAARSVLAKGGRADWTLAKDSDCLLECEVLYLVESLEGFQESTGTTVQG